MATTPLNSEYWLGEINKTEIELAELVNGDISTVRTSKTDEDTLTFQDMDKLIQNKHNYINYCNKRYEEELAKETQTESPGAILYIPREYGY